MGGIVNIIESAYTLVVWLLLNAMRLVKEQSDVMKVMRDGTKVLKSEIISSQQKVIGLQEELLASKTEQLETLQTTVKKSVESTVKEEFLSYSAAVSQDHQELQLAPERLKSVVRNVVEEDRSRSLMVFGLPEEDNEQLCEKISEVFLEIGEKPRVGASRLGKSGGSQGKARPVKVTLSSGAIVSKILAKARNLRKTEKHKSVFISRDRSQNSEQSTGLC